MENNPNDIIAGAILQAICLIIVGGAVLALVVAKV